MKTKTIKRTFHAIGDRGGDMAKAVGSGTIDIARRFGSGTSSLARRVGPKRGFIGLALLGVAIGGSIMVIRRIRARRQDGLATNNEPAASTATKEAWRTSHANSSDTRITH